MDTVDSESIPLEVIVKLFEEEEKSKGMTIINMTSAFLDKNPIKMKGRTYRWTDRKGDQATILGNFLAEVTINAIRWNVTPSETKKIFEEFDLIKKLNITKHELTDAHIHASNIILNETIMNAGQKEVLEGFLNTMVEMFRPIE